MVLENFQANEIVSQSKFFRKPIHLILVAEAEFHSKTNTVKQLSLKTLERAQSKYIKAAVR